MNPVRQQKRSVLVADKNHFDLSHAHRTTLDFFRLQPIFCKDMMAGDSFDVNVRTFLEAAPLATKVYGSAHLDLHAFFVPSRLLWDNWNNYYLGNTRANDPLYTIPAIYGDAIYQRFGENRENDGQFEREARRVFSGLGYPMYAESQDNSFTLSALPARAYQQIWWDYYRDSVNIPEVDKPSYINDYYRQYTSQDIALLMVPRYRCFHKDYISTLLRNPQLGNEAGASVTTTLSGSSSSEVQTINFSQSDNREFFGASPYPSVLRNVGANALRASMAMQRYLERLNVTGTRPLERVFALLGVQPDKTRLDMCEFIGAKTITVNVDGLVNNSSNVAISDTDNAFGVQKDLSGEPVGMGYQQGQSRASGQSDSFSYSATEYGYFIVIACLVPDYVNVNSVDRMFYRGLSTPNHDRFDFASVDFQGLGYQEVLASEVFFPDHASVERNAAWKSVRDGGSYDPYAVVGYTPKYEDYRYQGDRLSGDFMSLKGRNSMPQMVYARNFSKFIDPSGLVAGLNLTTATHADRADFDDHFVVANSEYDHFVMNNYIVCDAVRPLTANEMPTELSQLANSRLLDIANGGMRM